MNIISYFKNFNKTNITFYIDYLDEEKKEAIAPINHIRFKPKSTVKPTRSKTESITSSNSRFNHIKQHFSNPQTPSTSYTSKSNIDYIPRSHSSSITARTERWNQSRKESVYKKPKYVPIINSALSSANCLKCTISKSNIITLSQCKHTICKDCLQQHIKQSSDKLNTKCPICNIILTHQDLRSTLGTKQFFALLISPNLRKCDECNKLWCIHCITKENKEWFCKISKCQQNAINHVNDYAINKSENITQIQQLMQMIQQVNGGKYCDVVEDTLNSLHQFLETNVPIIIHIHIAKLIPLLIQDTHYRNLFEIGQGSGSSNQTVRSAHEAKMFGPIYNDAAPFDRPKYGCLNIGLADEGCVKARQYGDGYFMMNDSSVRFRTTMTIKDSFAVNGECGTLKHCNHLLTQLSIIELQEIIEAAIYQTKGGSKQSTYREIQIHGEVRLNRDIKSVHVPKIHQSNYGLVDSLNSFCETNKCELVWF